MWKTLAGCIKSWIVCHQGEVGRILGGDVPIFMHSRSHMTVDTRIPTDPYGTVRVFTYQANIASNERDAP